MANSKERQSNKIGINQGIKTLLDGYRFDSQQEASFYRQFIRGKCQQVSVHHPIRIIEPYQLGGTDCKGHDYKPDFVVIDQSGRGHLIDVKNSFTGYGVKADARLRFALIQSAQNQPVEVVIPRKGWFWLKIMDTKKKFEPIKMTSLDYNIHDYIGQ